MNRHCISMMAVAISMLNLQCATAAEIAIDRTWGGLVYFGINSFHAAGVNWYHATPGLLESRLDDGDDTFSIDSLTYAAGGFDVNEIARSIEIVEFPPEGFPGTIIQKQLHHTMRLDRVEWSNMPTYADLAPAKLELVDSDWWKAEPESAVESFQLRFLGEYTLMMDNATKSIPVDSTMTVRASDLPEFFFSAGSSYPDSLRAFAYPKLGPFTETSFSVEFEGLTRQVGLRGAFVHVPEPGAFGLAIPMGAALGVLLYRRARSADTRSLMDWIG